jgi:uncharacterized damage-inducible protein DinB
MKGHLDLKQLESYKKADLQSLARELGVSDEGTIKEIAARCAEVEVEIPDNTELTEEEKAAAAQAAKEDEAKRLAAAQAAGKEVVEVTCNYLDKQLNEIKSIGETFTVDKDRAAELLAAAVVKIKE